MNALSQIREFFQGGRPTGDIISRRVRVDRTRTPHEAHEVTGRRLYLNDAVVVAMPQGIGDEVEIFFFKVGRWMSDAGLEKEYESRGLVPVDPYSLAAVNEADPGFADKHPNATHWKDAAGEWCYAAFGRWDDDERYVRVDGGDDEWIGYWWFAGRRK